VQQGGSLHNLQVGAFGFAQFHSGMVHAQDVLKVMYGVFAGIKGARLFNTWHE
jgi:hypothetical protein